MLTQKPVLQDNEHSATFIRASIRQDAAGRWKLSLVLEIGNDEEQIMGDHIRLQPNAEFDRLEPLARAVGLEVPGILANPSQLLRKRVIVTSGHRLIYRKLP